MTRSAVFSQCFFEDLVFVEAQHYPLPESVATRTMGCTHTKKINCSEHTQKVNELKLAEKNQLIYLLNSSLARKHPSMRCFTKQTSAHRLRGRDICLAHREIIEPSFMLHFGCTSKLHKLRYRQSKLETLTESEYGLITDKRGRQKGSLKSGLLPLSACFCESCRKTALNLPISLPPTKRQRQEKPEKRENKRTKVSRKITTDLS